MSPLFGRRSATRVAFMTQRRRVKLSAMQRRGYVWTVRIIGVIAAIMFFFIVIHLLSSKPIHRDITRPVIIVSKEGEERH
jgi:ABC-type amino acid transport system permease subunit